MHRSEAQPRAFAHFLGGEEWLEDAREMFRGNARAGVADREHDSGSCAALRVGLRGLGGDCHESCGESEGAAAWHRIAGVEREIGDRVVEHRWVGLDGGQVRSEIAMDEDRRAEHAVEQVGGFIHDSVKVERTRKHRLLAAEGEELSGEICRTLGGAADALDVRRGVARQIAAVEQEVRVALDDGEDVV